MNNQEQSNEIYPILYTDSFHPNGEYNFPIGTEYFRYKDPMKEEEGLVKCKTTGKIWVSPELGGVYECLAESVVGNMDCNWNTTYETRTAVSDSELFKAYKRGDRICR
jgi:hypothetical protein